MYLQSITDLISPRNGDVISIYSNPMAGKTLMALSIAREYLRNGLPVYYLDTEGGAQEMAEAWNDRLPGMTDIPIDVKHSLEGVTGVFGTPFFIEISKGGKPGIMMGLDDKRKKNHPRETIMKTLRGDGIVIIDSMTSPIRGSLPMVQQAFPVRASLMALWFQAIYEMIDDAENHGCVWITHHSTYNPADKYQTNRGDIQGGSSALYYSKKILAMETPSKKVLKDNGYRKIWAIRSPYHTAETMNRWVQITDRGFVDSTPETVAQKLTEG